MSRSDVTVLVVVVVGGVVVEVEVIVVFMVKMNGTVKAYVVVLTLAIDEVPYLIVHRL